MRASTKGYDSYMYVQWSFSGDGQPCIYDPGRVGPVKLFDIQRVLLSETTFDHLPAMIKEKLEPWSYTAMLAEDSGLPVYDKIILTGQIRSSPFSLEFLGSRISYEGILGM